MNNEDLEYYKRQSTILLSIIVSLDDSIQNGSEEACEELENIIEAIKIEKALRNADINDVFIIEVVSQELRAEIEKFTGEIHGFKSSDQNFFEYMMKDINTVDEFLKECE